MRTTAILSVVLLLCSPLLAADDSLVVHEWGTFTSLQDESGRTIGGINSDDEPVPKFVHDLLKLGLIGSADVQRNNTNFQGWPRASLPVTMRLETPVLYVYPGSARTNEKLTVSVAFHGGWLTQFYPNAKPFPVPPENSDITSETVGRLNWTSLTVGGRGTIPKTDEHVWLAPRGPDSALLSEPGGETEKYLFYRGVGHVDAPLKVTRLTDHLQIDVAANPTVTLNPAAFQFLWYAEFHTDGSIAFRQIEPLRTGSSGRVTTGFSSGDFSPESLSALRQSMQNSLESAGLFPAEAKAMLDTWELSYFKSWGARLFYIVPNEWTEKVLPIQISPKPTELHRVMVGRIDLVTSEHRALLKQLASATDVKAQDDQLWKAYDQLGRFRNALLIDEQTRTRSSVLKMFMDGHGLQPSFPQ